MTSLNQGAATLLHRKGSIFFFSKAFPVDQHTTSVHSMAGSSE